MSERKQEEEYFARQDREKLAKLKAEEAEAARLAEAEALRQLHHHRCGKCGNPMTTHPFRGVAIEGCGHCGAVLLDRGELESLAGQDQSGLLSGFVALFGGK